MPSWFLQTTREETMGRMEGLCRKPESSQSTHGPSGLTRMMGLSIGIPNNPHHHKGVQWRSSASEGGR